MRFQTHECPLCNKMLRVKVQSGVTTYYCTNEKAPGNNGKSHYEVETDGKQTIQHLYAYPYAVDNFANAARSRVYQWKGTRWSFLKEIPFINAQTHDTLLNHLSITVPLDQ